MQSKVFSPTGEFWLALRVILFFTLLYIVDGAFTQLISATGPDFNGACYQFPVILGCVPIWNTWEFAFGGLVVIYFFAEAHHFFRTRRRPAFPRAIVRKLRGEDGRSN